MLTKLLNSDTKVANIHVNVYISNLQKNTYIVKINVNLCMLFNVKLDTLLFIYVEMIRSE